MMILLCLKFDSYACDVESPLNWIPLADKIVSFLGIGHDVVALSHLVLSILM